MCDLQVDSQEHALACHKVTQHLNSENINILKLVTYSDIFSSPDRQDQVTRIVQQLIDIRQKLQKKAAPGLSPPWHCSGPYRGIILLLLYFHMHY